MGGAPGTRRPTCWPQPAGRAVARSSLGLQPRRRVERADALAAAGRGYRRARCGCRSCRQRSCSTSPAGVAKDWESIRTARWGRRAAAGGFAWARRGGRAQTASLMGGLGSASLALPSGAGARWSRSARLWWPRARREFWATLRDRREFRLGDPTAAGGLPRPSGARRWSTTGIVATDAGLDVAAARDGGGSAGGRRANWRTAHQPNCSRAPRTGAPGSPMLRGRRAVARPGDPPPPLPSEQAGG
jgi:hypothetical protein